MTYEIIEATSIEEARDYASRGGRYLVLDPDTLQQIENAEAAGGFEGGQIGNADGAPYSVVGETGDTFSSQNDSAPSEDLDLEGAWRLKKAMTIDDAVEHVMDLKDVIETWVGQATGPIILVPKKELNRWLGIQDPADGA